MKAFKIILKILLALVATLILVAAIYVAYVFISYYRIVEIFIAEHK